MPRFMISAKLTALKEKFYRSNHFLKNQISSRGWVIIMFCLISTVCLLYLWQVNSLATKGYEMKNLEEKVGELREKNKTLELDIAQLRSSERITKVIEQLEMVEVARVEYLKADGGSVAINR